MAKHRQPETIETPGPETAPFPPGVYSVRMGEYPRKLIDTRLPAGPTAEKIAAERYLAWLGLAPRPGFVPVVMLSE